MLARFCNLCSKNLDTTFANLSKRCKTTGNGRHRKKVVRGIIPPTDQKYGIPIITCKNSALNFYKGYSYPKHEKILLASSGWDHYKSSGDHFFLHPEIHKETKKREEESQENDKFKSFHDFRLNPSIVGNLESLGISEPLYVQKLGIPPILDGNNTVLAAETGCGKTLAYLLPMMHKVLEWKQTAKRGSNSPLGLIVTPTRELAVQIGIELVKLSTNLGIRTKIITGGRTRKMMLNPSVQNVDILVGSFGVISKLTTNMIYKLDFVRYIVLDEADALFHESFEEKLKPFMSRVPVGYGQCPDFDELPNSAQLILASATMPQRISEILQNVVNVDSLKYVTTGMLHHILVQQKFMRMSPSKKVFELLKYVKPKVANKEQIIIFSNTNATSQWVSMFLNENDIKSINLNGTMPLYLRRGKYKEFLDGKCLVLSMTNAGSRGLDTVSVKHILNYEFPLDTSDYIHRCGRTGRVGSTGDSRVTNFISQPLEFVVVRKIEKAVRKMQPIPIVNVARGEEVKEEEEVSYPPFEEEIIENLEAEGSIPY